jgi:hypothetical protein
MLGDVVVRCHLRDEVGSDVGSDVERIVIGDGCVDARFVTQNPPDTRRRHRQS